MKMAITIKTLSVNGLFEEIAKMVNYIAFANNKHRLVILREGWSPHSTVIYSANHVLEYRNGGFIVFKNRNSAEKLCEIVGEVVGAEFVINSVREGREMYLVPAKEEDTLFLKLAGWIR